jgi:DNA (cytosine-5)-methyltransferase 1
MHDKTAAEFFAGIGLVRMALEQAGWNVVYATDIDPRKRMMYVDNFGRADFHLRDIRTIKGRDVPDVGLATASFPCIDVSLAGNRAGLNGTHSSLFWHFARILIEMRGRKPHFVLLENVSGLLTSHGGKDLRAIIEQLNTLGYACDLMLVDAARFLPQSRPRLFIAGRREIRKGPLVLQEHAFRPAAVTDFILRNRRLLWDITGLPEPPPVKRGLQKYLDIYGADHKIWWNSERQRHLFAQMNSLHRARLRKLVHAEGVHFATVYKRIRDGLCRAEIRTDEIAGCLRTPRGGSSKQFVIQAGDGEWRVRHMTAREYARLQGAPTFRLRNEGNVALLGFGDAVCVPAVKWVVENWFQENSLGLNATQRTEGIGAEVRAN